MNYEDIFNSIKKSFREENNSHAFLFVTNNLERTRFDLYSLIKEINCKGNCSKDKPCMVCNLIDAGTNPDLINIFPDGKEIKVEQIENIINKFTTKPFISKYSMYVINKCDQMNLSSANKILKFLEEPVGKIIGFYITDNLENVLPTIKSRCEIYHLNYENKSILDYLNINEDYYEKYYNEAMKLITYLNEDKKYLLMNKATEFSKFERFELDIILNLVRNMYIIKYNNITDGLNIDYLNPIINAIASDDLVLIVKRIKILDNIINDFKLNVNMNLFINKLFLDWE